MKRLLIGLCLFLAVGSCSNSPESFDRVETGHHVYAELAAELVADQPTEQTRKGWDRDLFPNEQIFDLMRAAAARRGMELLACVFLRTGVHPYSAYSFIETGGEVRIVETAMYWGGVQGKWVTTVPRESVDRFLVAASGILDCSEDSEGFGGFAGAAVMTRETTCRAEAFTEAMAPFVDALLPLLEGRSRTYEPPLARPSG